jgi:hypothetical protein
MLCRLYQRKAKLNAIIENYFSKSTHELSKIFNAQMILNSSFSKGYASTLVVAGPSVF